MEDNSTSVDSLINIDSERCNGCGICMNACPQDAITIYNHLATINQALCIQCGKCINVCPAGAIRAVAPANAQTVKGGDNMIYGFSRGFGRRGGLGFGFRGTSPSWPYVGRGRGGLPRCWYPGAATTPFYPLTYTPQMPQEQEAGWLKSQAEAIKVELNRVEARIKDLETKK